MKNKNVQIVMFGDSITNDGRWDDLLQRADVLNAGFSGFTTGQLLAILDAVVLKLNPNICFFMGGINDISVGMSIADIFQNQKDIIAPIRSSGIIPVMQSTLNVRFMDDLNHQVNMLNDKISNFASQEGLDHIDVNALLVENGNLKREFTTDGVHLTERAYESWAAQVHNVLNTYGI